MRCTIDPAAGFEYPTAMGGSLRRVAQGVAFFVFTCAAGVAGYVASGWSLSDAIYMVIITVFGVGYGEVRPILTSDLRAFTIVVIVGGYAAAIYAVGGFIQFITEGEIRRTLGERRMSREIDGLRNHVIVCGFGRTGRIVASQLETLKQAFVVIEQDDGRVEEAHEFGYAALAGDASREEVLLRAGIDRARALASVLSDDAQNVFITLGARELNGELMILARAEDPASERKLRRSGANEVVLPTAIGGQRIADLIVSPGVEEVLGQRHTRTDLGQALGGLGLRMEEFRVERDSGLLGRRLDEIEVRGNRGFLIVALRSADGAIAVNPGGESLLGLGDVVIVIGHTGDLPELRRRYEARQQLVYRGARS